VNEIVSVLSRLKSAKRVPHHSPLRQKEEDASAADPRVLLLETSLARRCDAFVTLGGLESPADARPAVARRSPEREPCRSRLKPHAAGTEQPGDAHCEQVQREQHDRDPDDRIRPPRLQQDHHADLVMLARLASALARYERFHSRGRPRRA